MIRFLTILIAVLLVATAVIVYVTKNKLGENTPTVAQSEQIGGNFSLINQDGAVVSDASFRGKIMLVFFGFTSCTDICPGTAATLAKTMQLLGDNAKDVAPIFITVDPKRDNPQALKTFLVKFDSRITGLTGSSEQLKNVADAYKAYFTDNSDKNMGANMNMKPDADEIEHSGFIYIMDKNGAYAKHFLYTVSAEDLKNAVLGVLK